MLSLPLLCTVALYFALTVLGALLEYPSGYSIGLHYRPISPLDREIRDIRQSDILYRCPAKFLYNRL
jgi:hypothetical protein